MTDQLLTAAEAAEALDVDRSTVLRLVERGELAVAHENPGRTGAKLFAVDAVAALAAARRSSS